VTKDFANTAIAHVLLIYNSSSQSLHKDDFKGGDTHEFTAEEIIAFLVMYAYLETERADDIYFLSPETYELVEASELEFSINSRAGVREEEVEPVLTEEKQKKLDLASKKKSRDEKRTRNLALLLILIGIIYVAYTYSSW
jgi:hypothetical protein